MIFKSDLYYFETEIHFDVHLSSAKYIVAKLINSPDSMLQSYIVFRPT